MSLEKFTEDELEVTVTEGMFGPVEDFNTPITPRENLLRIHSGKTPLWIPDKWNEVNILMPDCDPEHRARSCPPEGRGKDGWGVEWIWVPEVMGAMVAPGDPIVKDITHWEDYVTPPDPETWDWEGCKARYKYDPRKALLVNMGSCLFERLIALCDFDKAAMALVDEDQQDAVHRLFRAETDVLKKYFDMLKKYFNPDIICFNDDWGSQKSPFFSVATAKEMILPYVKEICDYGHSLGLIMDDHCCGFVEPFVGPIMIEAGIESWEGQMLNDKRKLKEQYGHSLIFESWPKGLDTKCTEEEIDAAIEDFMAHEGADNHVFLYSMVDSNLDIKKKIYTASRKNYDRLKANGTAID